MAHGEGIGSPASDFPLIDRAWTLAEDVEEFLREEAATLQTAAGLTPEEELDLLVQHDRVRFETEHGVSEKAIPIAESILEKVPTFIPVRNNPSLPYFQQGDIEKAIAMAQEVLAEDPSNFHALANLVRYTFLSGAFAEADEYATRLRQKEIVAEAPNFPPAHNQLAVAYEQQGREEEARALLEEIHERFPDYFFGRASLARLFAEEARVKEAKALVAPLMEEKRLHISEFRALANAHMAIAMAGDEKAAARSWLAMWQEIEEDHPDQAYWQLRLQDPGALMAALKRLISGG